MLTPETAIMVKKGTYGSSQLPAVLQGIKDQGTVLTSIELAGVSTTVCVFHNAVMLYNMFPECEIILDVLIVRKVGKLPVSDWLHRYRSGRKHGNCINLGLHFL